MHTHIHTLTNTQICTHTIYTHKHTYSHKHSNTHHHIYSHITHAHANTRTPTHSYTYTYHTHTHTYACTPHTSTHAPEAVNYFLSDCGIFVVPRHFMKVGSFASQPPLPFFTAILKGAVYRSVVLFSIHVYYGKMHVLWNWLS